jgi:hypothetical protein
VDNGFLWHLERTITQGTCCTNGDSDGWFRLFHLKISLQTSTLSWGLTWTMFFHNFGTNSTEYTKQYFPTFLFQKILFFRVLWDIWTWTVLEIQKLFHLQVRSWTRTWAKSRVPPALASPSCADYNTTAYYISINPQKRNLSPSIYK